MEATLLFSSLLASGLAWLQACTGLWVVDRRQTVLPASLGLVPGVDAEHGTQRQGRGQLRTQMQIS